MCVVFVCVGHREMLRAQRVNCSLPQGSRARVLGTVLGITLRWSVSADRTLHHPASLIQTALCKQRIINQDSYLFLIPETAFCLTEDTSGLMSNTWVSPSTETSTIALGHVSGLFLKIKFSKNKWIEFPIKMYLDYQ